MEIVHFPLNDTSIQKNKYSDILVPAFEKPSQENRCVGPFSSEQKILESFNVTINFNPTGELSIVKMRRRNIHVFE